MTYHQLNLDVPRSADYARQVRIVGSSRFRTLGQFFGKDTVMVGSGTTKTQDAASL